jgi:peptidyl-prolyl cis-trans isomerase A (cyclophilin A)
MANSGDPKFPPIQVDGSGDLYARLRTTEGIMVVRLEEKNAPKTVANFVGLATGTIQWRDPKTDQAQMGVPLYDGVRFHRVIPDFMIQCGDPLSRHTDPGSTARWGRGGPGYTFGDEFHADLRHKGAGVLSMANAGPGTNGSQWFITERDTPHLDGKHSVFGKVVVGLDVMRKIARVERGPGDRPVKDVVLTNVEIFRNPTVPAS